MADGKIDLGGLPIVAPGSRDYLVGTQLGAARRWPLPSVLNASVLITDAIDGVVADAQADIAPVIAGLGYLPPVPYAEGLVVSTSRFTVSQGGQVYAPVAWPFPTGASFDPAQWRLVQGVTGTDLAAGTGAGMVGFIQSGAGTLRALKGPPTQAPLAPLVSDRLKDIFYNGRTKSSTANVTVYINPVTGSDTNAGTLAAPLRTIQSALDRCPENLYHSYIIDIATAASLPVSYDEDLLLSGVTVHSKPGDISISSRLRIVGTGPDPSTSNPRQVKVGSLTLVGVHGVAAVWAYGFELQRAKPYYESAACVGVFGSGEVAVQNLAFAPGVNCAGVRFYGSKGVVKLSDFTNCTNAVWGKREATISVSDCVGTTSAAAHRAEEGASINIIRNGINAGLDPTFLIVGGGGFFIDQAGNWMRTRGMYYGIPASGAAEGASGSSVGVDTFAAGYKFKAPGASSVCIGLNAETLGGTSVAVGANAKTDANASNTALGGAAQCTGGRRSTAVGSAANAAFENSTAVGYNATTTAINQVKLGNGCSAVADLDYETLQPGRGVIMKSPNGTRYRVRVTDAGLIETIAV